VREPVGGLVLQSTFTSMPDIGAEVFPWLPVRRLARIRYETCRKLPQIKVPVLIMHSRGDELIGFHHCERNFAAANEPKLLCEITGRHNTPMADPKQFIAGLEKFLELMESARLAPEPGSAANP
jgi:pimeloyl-ACP methyl ester carboxylesterase